MKQSKKDAAEKPGEVIEENLIYSLSESESNMEEDVARGDENEENNVKKTEDVDSKLLRDKEAFAYKLRRLRAQLFEENGNRSMSSSSVEIYENMVKKFVTKFKHYRMPEGVRLLKYEVQLRYKR